MSKLHRPLEPTALYCFGFGLWKHGFVRAFLRDFSVPVHFVVNALHARVLGLGSGSAVVVWGRRESPALRALTESRQIPIWRMEDGFLRSAGLGTDFRVPSSLVLDTRGIYFDPNGPSDLEFVLENESFSDTELCRAAALRKGIVDKALSKYNFARGAPSIARPSGETRVILVPGQVEDDASIACGAVDVRTNLALLEAVRSAAPDAYIVFKPHPDVLAGNRSAGQFSLARAEQLADVVVTDASLPACLDIVDEVHTITSLVGFEGLLRGKEVHCYGRPFYAGWGLTHDRCAISRRTRRLSLDMLVAGALIRYPRYIRQSDWALTTPEVVMDELGRALADGPRQRVRASHVVRRVRMVVAGLRGKFRNGT